jgi:hypothetical protein
MWFLAKHYLLVAVPILLIEILADLKKDPREGRMPEDDVVWLAGKLLDSKLNAPYQVACIESLLGHDPPAGFNGHKNGIHVFQGLRIVGLHHPATQGFLLRLSS